MLHAIRFLFAFVIAGAGLCLAASGEGTTGDSTSAASTTTPAAAAIDVPLTDEPSRADLKVIRDGDLSEVPDRSKPMPPPPPPPPPEGQPPPPAPAPPNYVVFPVGDADSVFGIDVSHYDPAPDWATVAVKKVRFVYVKATQGVNSYDPKFATNWSSLETFAKSAASDPTVKPILRGAYHFLSAQGDAGLQAVNFLHRVGAYGVRDPQAAIDLPPCIDLEWDLVKNDSDDWDDRWDKLSSDEIVDRVKLFISVVEAETGIKPVIYTNKSWWNEHMEATAADALKDYKIWVADYGRSPLEGESPRTVEGLGNNLWQFTDQAVVGGAGIVDANTYMGTATEFDSELGKGAVKPPKDPTAPPN